MADQIDFRDERERELFQLAKLGEDVRAFLARDPVGQMLHERAKIQIRQAEADALDVLLKGELAGLRGWFLARRKLQQIKFRAETARLFIQWLGQAIIDGDAATQAIDEESS